MQLTLLDWTVFFGYFLLLATLAVWVNRRRADTSSDYFLGGNNMPPFLVAISVLATSQSAATFLGGPDMGFRGNLTYLATNIGAIIASLLVIKWLIPRYYQLKVTTVYELLESRFNATAKNHAGKMYLFGRVFASGARLYMAALAVAMLLFSNIDASSVIIAIILLATTVDNGFRVAEQIRTTIEKLEFTFEGKTFSITISAGVAGFADWRNFFAMDFLMPGIAQRRAKRQENEVVK